MRGYHLVTVGLSLFVAGCAQETGQTDNPDTSVTNAKSTKTMTVRTTAYTHSEPAHRRYGTSNAIDGRLRYNGYRSAAADWSRFPVGTTFTIRENGARYIIDDYGSALVGTNTIDLYVPSRAEMNRWGVRRVTISIIEPGSYAQSLEILRPRRGVSYVRKMVENLERQQ